VVGFEFLHFLSVVVSSLEGKSYDLVVQVQSVSSGKSTDLRVTQVVKIRRIHVAFWDTLIWVNVQRDSGDLLGQFQWWT
jgi:hypothetical protein